MVNYVYQNVNNSMSRCLIHQKKKARKAGEYLHSPIPFFSVFFFCNVLPAKLLIAPAKGKNRAIILVAW